MPDKVPCPKCGEENYPSDRQCMSCGAQLQVAAPSPPTPPMPQAPQAYPSPVQPLQSQSRAPKESGSTKKRGALSRGDLPVYLYAMAILPVGIPVITLGGALPAVIGVGLAGMNLSIARSEKIPLAARISIILVVSLVGLGLALSLVMAAHKARAGA